jgi:transcriptional regulator with XRE-family HTH domain
MSESGGMPNIAELVKTRREAKQWSQARLAQEVGTKQQTIEKIEKGKIKRSSFLPHILTVLEISLNTLVPQKKGHERERIITAGAEAPLMGPKDLPVHGAAEGGKGAVIVTTDPVEYVARPHPLLNVRDSYGIIVVEDSMVPEFEPGDIALVHPHLPPTIGVSCVFYAQQPDGTVHALIKRLRRISSDAWHVRQWNPRDGDKHDLVLKKAEWQTCHVTVGRYSRR